MNITWDKLQGASAEVTNQLTSVTRSGSIDNISAKATADPDVLIKGLLDLFPKVISGYPNLSTFSVLSRLLLRSNGSTNSLDFTASFTRPTQGFANGGNPSVTAWMVEQDTATAIEQEEIDLEGFPIQTIYKPGVVSLDRNTRLNQNGPEYGIHTAEQSVERPRRIIRIHGYMIGMPADAIEDAQDKVNDRAWSGKPTGYWLCRRVSSRPENAYPYQGSPRRHMYRVTAEFSTKVNRDWSHTAIHRDLNGRIPADMLNADRAARIKEMIYDPQKFPYTIRRNNLYVAGFIKVGLYFPVDFDTIFGFNLAKFA